MSQSTLTVLKQIARGLAAQFGESCEVIVFDLARNHIDHSIVHIENGHVTNRKVGGGPSQIVLDTIAKARHGQDELLDQLAYLTKTDNGRILKSSTIFVKDDDGQPRYIFSINFDITGLLALESTISSLTSYKPSEKSEKETPKRITQDVNELLDELIEQSVALVGIPVPLMTKGDKIRAINYLNEAGAFLITKSGDRVSRYFGISKYTLYSYVNINNKGEKYR